MAIQEDKILFDSWSVFRERLAADKVPQGHLVALDERKLWGHKTYGHDYMGRDLRRDIREELYDAIIYLFLSSVKDSALHNVGFHFSDRKQELLDNILQALSTLDDIKVL